MQSAFVDIGLERDAFLYVSDFFEDTEEYDKIVSSVEDEIAQLQEGGRSKAPSAAPPPAASPAPPTSPVEQRPELAASPVIPATAPLTPETITPEVERPPVERPQAERPQV